MNQSSIVIKLQNARWRFSQIIGTVPLIETGQADASLIVRWAQDGLDDVQKLLDAQLTPPVRGDNQ